MTCVVYMFPRDKKKHKMFAIFLLFFLFKSSTAVIYRLNESDYARMPPMFHMDPYESCYDGPEALYCTAELALVSDKPSPLLTMIQQFSDHITHYNHTLLRHGICLTQTCKKFYENTTGDLRLTLEACVNESLYSQYKLKARVSNAFDCSKQDKYMNIDNVDLTVGVICIVILCANIIASIYDCFSRKEDDDGGLRFIYCFSIFRNWTKLTASPVDGRESRLQGLRGLHGIRTINIILTIFGHSTLLNLMFASNPEFIEGIMVSWPYHILLNGTLIMQTFLLISSFLLVYKWLIHSEEYEPSWKMLPKQFLLRWLRLTPPYALILGLTATWFGHFSSGPYWKKLVSDEMTYCRKDWWRHLLYINNYYDDSQCMVQSWYLAADTQLYYMAAIVFMLCRTLRARKVILSFLFVLGMIIPALHTYFQYLDGNLIISQETVLKLFNDDATFNNVYKRGHTNLAGYVIGMAIGYMVYDWQKANVDPKKYKKTKYVFWTLFPLGCLCCISGGIFYADAPRPPVYVNVLFAALMKPIFAIIFASVIVGVIVRCEGSSLYRSILEWRGWTTPSRLSFSAYLLHIAIIRILGAMQTTTARSSVFSMTEVWIMTTLCSFIGAFFFWMLVEAPFGNLVQECLKKPKTPAKKENKESPVNKEDAKNIDNIPAKIAPKTGDKTTDQNVSKKP